MNEPPVPIREDGTSVTHSTIDSPIGPLTLVGDSDALTGIYFSEHTHQPDPRSFGPRDDGRFDDVTRELGQYFAGERTTFDVVLRPAGNAFQQRVWALLRQIPYGQTRTYGQLATELGDPGLARAVGSANGRNPISVIVPCHRVVGANGNLVGYAGGLERKRFLLGLEELPGSRGEKLF